MHFTRVSLICLEWFDTCTMCMFQRALTFQRIPNWFQHVLKCVSSMFNVQMFLNHFHSRSILS